MLRKCPLVILILILVSLVPGCSNKKDLPGLAVLAYHQALISGDYNQLANLSCNSWESQAKTDFDSFAAVNAVLQDAQCQSQTVEGNSAVVACTGKIIANYGNEVLEIDLSAQTYQAEFEGGEWRMCGYR
ncbi:MAG: hypothetical protein GYA34_01255 [Chloroflexi bacterium]|nr:hypothetical protein [Chloroflexota bacterium]